MEEEFLREDYFFQTIEEYSEKRVFVLVIYDIVDNKRRLKLAKYLQGYGTRVQKSAFEAMISAKKYEKLIRELPGYIKKNEDSLRVYKITGKSQMISWGVEEDWEDEEVILI